MVRKVIKSLLLLVAVAASCSWSVQAFSYHTYSAVRRSPRAVIIPPSSRRASVTTVRQAATAPIAAASMANKLAIVGRIGGAVVKILRVRAKRGQILKDLASTVDVADIGLLFICAFCTKPFARRYYNYRNEDETKFEGSTLARVSTTVQQLSFVTAAVYLFDMVTIVLKEVGFDISPNLQSKVAKALYLTWAAWRARVYQKHWLRKALEREPGKDDEARALGRIFDGVIAICLFFFLEDVFHFGLGKGIYSVLTAGGTAALVLSLASKSLATTFVNGIAVKVSRRFAVGDTVTLGDGTHGTVVKISYFETQIKGTDGIVTRIPNDQVASQRIRNLSNTGNCQVKQQLWFKFDDIDKIPAVIDALKAEIRASCPKLITDGSRPFSVFWTDIQKDHINVVVKVNFHFKPFGKEYLEIKQSVMEAIARAVKKAGVELCLPNYICFNQDITPKQDIDAVETDAP